MEESNYQRWRLSPQSRNLLTLAGLPLIDGFFLAFLATGMWQDPWHALAFGLTAFSGAGCVVAAMRLQGNLAARLAQVTGIYAVVALGAVAISTMRPLFESMLPANLHLFTGVFLLGLGLWVSDIAGLRRVAIWMGFEAAVKAMIAASVIHGLISGVTWEFSVEPAVLRALALPISAGFGLTVVGMLCGYVIDRAADQRLLNGGAGLSLLAMGLAVLGMDIPSMVVIAPLVVAFGFTTAALGYRGLRESLGYAPQSESG